MRARTFKKLTLINTALWVAAILAVRIFTSH
jgi:hypothetical protein